MLKTVFTRRHVPSAQHGLYLEQPVEFVALALDPGCDEERTGNVLAADARDGELGSVDRRLIAGAGLPVARVAVFQFRNVNCIVFTKISLMQRLFIGSGDIPVLSWVASDRRLSQ